MGGLAQLRSVLPERLCVRPWRIVEPGPMLLFASSVSAGIAANWAVTVPKQQIPKRALLHLPQDRGICDPIGPLQEHRLGQDD